MLGEDMDAASAFYHDKGDGNGALFATLPDQSCLPKGFEGLIFEGLIMDSRI